MGWGADGSAFAVTGALFLVCWAIARRPIARARRHMVALTLAAAAVFIAAAVLSWVHGGWTSSSWIWTVTLLPIAVITLLGPRALAGLSVKHAAAKCVPPKLAARRKAPSAPETADVAASSRTHMASDPAASGAELADLAYAHPELRVAIAANPATPANVLGWLASSGDDDVVDAIASRGSEHTSRGAPKPPPSTAERPGTPRGSGT